MRVSVLVLLISCASILVGCSAGHGGGPTALPAPTDAWLMYQGNPSHNAAVSSNLSPSSHWTFKAPGKINGGLALSGRWLYFGTFGGHVVALDAANGHQIWDRPVDNTVMSTPIVVDGLVIAGTGENGSLGGVKGSFVYESGDDVAGDVIWGRAEGDHIFAFDAVSGSRRWAYRTAGEDMPSGVVSNDRYVFANGDRHIYGLRVSDGQALWRSDLPGIATMASANNTENTDVVSACDFSHSRSHTLAFDATNGHLKWSVPEGNCDSSPTIGGGRVFVSGAVGNRQPFGYGGRLTVAAIELSNGRVDWRYSADKLGRYTSVGSSERAIAGTFAEGVYFQPSPIEDRLYAFDGSSGKIRWTFETQAPVKMSPVVASGHLYVGDTAGLLYDLDAASGKLLRARIFSKPFSTSPPIIAGKTIIVADDDVVEAFASSSI